MYYVNCLLNMCAWVCVHDSEEATCQSKNIVDVCIYIYVYVSIGSMPIVLVVLNVLAPLNW